MNLLQSNEIELVNKQVQKIKQAKGEKMQ